MPQRRFAVTLLVISLLLPSFAFGQQLSSPPARESAPTSTTQPPPSSPSSSSPAQSTATAQVAAITTDAKNLNDPVERIKDEGLNRSQVMQTASYLTDVIGPRLTLSPNMKRANTWTRDKMTEWGLKNAHLEAWGPFGRGWSLKRFAAQVIEPQTIPLIAYPKAWSPGTDGVLTGEVVYVDASTEADLQRYKVSCVGQSCSRERRARDGGALHRARKPIERRGVVADGGRTGPGEGAAAATPDSRRPTPAQRQALLAFAVRRAQFFVEEGAALLVDPSRAGDGGTLFVQSASVAQPRDTPADRRISSWSKNAPKMAPQIVVAVEDYNRMARMLQQGEKVRMSVDLAVQFHDEDEMSYNTIAEIPGTDLKDEIVMLGAHMDSWHGGTGATDNAAGVAVVMEAVRILQALKLQPRRTIRVGLWSGEEQGLLGSRAHVAKHFGTVGNGSSAAAAMAAMIGGGATPKVNQLPGYDKFSAYFNLDNGTGRIRGVYLQRNEAVRPIFEKWLQPFREMGASTLTGSNTGGTDHLAFDAIGLPGFQFIQDEIEYDTRTHHSNQDVYDRLQADDLKQASVIMAAFVYNTAMLPEKLPRKSVSAK